MKRLLAFALLMVLGFLALKFAVGDEQMTSAKQKDPAEAVRDPQPVPDQGDPIRVDKEGTEMQFRGEFTIARMRELPRIGGGIDRQRIYELHCRDSMPASDGRHRLVGLTVKLFDDGEHVATLTAARALVELQVDEKKQRSLRENRELELEDALLTTVPGGKLPPMRFQVAKLLASVDETAVTMRTPDKNEPVTVVVDGDNGGQLSGLGLTASLPRDRKSGSGLLDLVIHRDPVVVMQGVQLASKEQMHYQEHLASGSARITLQNQVKAELLGKSDLGVSSLGDSLVVTGDRMVGWMQRTQRQKTAMGTDPGSKSASSSGGSMVWTTLRLLGSPARVTTDAVVLESPRLTVLPGPTGELAQITADGGDSELQQLGERAATFRSKHPIHLLRTKPSIGEVHRSFGFPSFGLGLLGTLEIVTFEGEARVDAGDGVSVRADRRMFIFRPQQEDSESSALIARGDGNVRVTHGNGDEQIVATGNSGFFLSRTPTGDTLELGRDDPAAAQDFEFARGKLKINGRGSARVTQSLDGRVELQLRSTEPSLAGVFAERGAELFGELRAAKSILATITDDGIESFVATGDATTIDVLLKGAAIRAEATRVEQISATTWRLTGTDGTLARLHHEGAEGKQVIAKNVEGDLSAPRIDVHRIAERSILLDAFADGSERARIDAKLPTRKNAPVDAMLGTVTATADRIRVMPWAVGPRNLLSFATGLPATVIDVTAHVGQPWLLASGKVVADFLDPASGAVHAEAAMLASSVGARSMLLSGDPLSNTPAVLHRDEKDRRVLSAEGARIRFSEDDGEHISVLTTYAGHSHMVPPRVSFRSATKGGGSKLGWLSGECQGEIEVLREAVLFHGPVQANSLLADGTQDPQGMHVDAKRLTMRRHRDTGELLVVEAGGGVTVHWRDLYAKSERVELDLRWQKCIAEDDNGAEVRFGGGRSYVARRIEANYETYTVRSYFGRLQQSAPVTAER